MDDFQDSMFKQVENEARIVAAMLRRWIRENWENKYSMFACYAVLMAEMAEMLCALSYQLNMPKGKFKELVDDSGLKVVERYERFLKEMSEKKGNDDVPSKEHKKLKAVKETDEEKDLVHCEDFDDFVKKLGY